MHWRRSLLDTMISTKSVDTILYPVLLYGRTWGIYAPSGYFLNIIMRDRYHTIEFRIYYNDISNVAYKLRGEIDGVAIFSKSANWYDKSFTDHIQEIVMSPEMQDLYTFVIDWGEYSIIVWNQRIEVLHI